MGKGSKQRPMLISQDEFQKRWDKIFNKKSELINKSTNKKREKK